jgi:hypothetical protein
VTSWGASGAAAAAQASSKASLPARETIAATATGRSRCTKRSKKMRNRIRLIRSMSPDTVTPTFGTESSSTRRRI